MRTEFKTKPKRVVIKLGTGVLTDSRKQLDPVQMGQLVYQFAALCKSGVELIVVTSGAVGAGMGRLGFDKRPKDVAELQGCAAVGQSRLMAIYEHLFSIYGLNVAQVLLTHADLQDYERHGNARNALTTLLKHGVVPIINENDVVSTQELKFGDNDRLSALVSALVSADLLIILTTVDGVIENFGSDSARVISRIDSIDKAIEDQAGGTTSATAVGGMKSKIQAAHIVMRSGIPLVIASGRKNTVVADILAGKDEGTFFAPQTARLKGYKRWIAFFHHPKGTVVVDDGAREALCNHGKSLLRPGICSCEGDFVVGDAVSIRSKDGVEFARGLAEMSAADIRAEKPFKAEVVHRDNMVVL